MWGVHTVLLASVLFQRSGSGTVQKGVRKCGVWFPSFRVAALGLRAFSLLDLFSSWNPKRKKPHHKDRRASRWRRSWDVWMDMGTDAKKSQNKLRVTRLRWGTIAACVWKLIGSATASFHRAECKGLFVATGRTKAKQCHLLSPVWVCPSEAGWLCTSIYWGSQQLLQTSSLPTVGLSSSQQID